MNNKRVILIGPSSLRLEESIQIDLYKDEIELFFLKKQRVVSKNSRSDYIFYSNQIVDDFKVATIDKSYNKILRLLISDPVTFYIAERDRLRIVEGSFLATVRISSYLVNILDSFNSIKPEIIIFHNYPHELYTYIQLKAAIFLGIKVYIIHFSALPWRMRLSVVEKDLSLKSISDPSEKIEKGIVCINAYKNSLIENYEKSMPAADRALISNTKNSYISFQKEFSDFSIYKLPKILCRIYLKIMAYRGMTKSYSQIPSGKKITFFLHCQPEESTIPRGRFYACQINAIIALRAALPDDIAIIVKEHPSMYRYGFAIGMVTRDKTFYEAISKIKGVHIANIKNSTLSLINDSIAISTISGTVTLEALLRGKPVISFGESYYSDFKGVINFDEYQTINLKDLSNHLSNATYEDLKLEFLRTFGRNTSVPDDYRSDARYGVECALNYILSEYASKK